MVPYDMYQVLFDPEIIRLLWKDRQKLIVTPVNVKLHNGAFWRFLKKLNWKCSLVAQALFMKGKAEEQKGSYVHLTNMASQLLIM